MSNEKGVFARIILTSISWVIVPAYVVGGLLLYRDWLKRPWKNPRRAQNWLYAILSGIGGIFYYFMVIRPARGEARDDGQEDGAHVVNTDDDPKVSSGK